MRVVENLTNATADIPALLTMEMVRKFFLPLSARTIFRMISVGTFPRADVAMGGKVRLWKRETVEAWIEAQASVA